MAPERLAERAERVELKVEVERAETIAPGRYEARNISVGGICLQSQEREEVGGFVALRFPLGEEAVTVYAEIVWCRPDREFGGRPEGHRLGLRFVAIGHRERDLICRYVEANDPIDE